MPFLPMRLLLWLRGCHVSKLLGLNSGLTQRLRRQRNGEPKDPHMK